MKMYKCKKCESYFEEKELYLDPSEPNAAYRKKFLCPVCYTAGNEAINGMVSKEFIIIDETPEDRIYEV